MENINSSSAPKRAAEMSDDDDASSKPAKRRHTDDQDLCEHCSSKTFYDLLHDHRPDLQNFIAARNFGPGWPLDRSLRCNVCRLMMHTLRQQYTDETMQRYLTHDELVCTIDRRRGAENMRFQHITPFTQLCVGLRCRTRATDPPLNRERWTWHHSLLDMIRDPSVTSSSEASKRQLSQDSVFQPATLAVWLRECDSAHEHSSQPSVDLEPLLSTGRFRLLDVRDNIITTMRDIVPYVALSYVWGTSMSHYADSLAPEAGVTAASTVDSRVVRWDRVPKTVKDAAGMVKALGERYLWVDALCIDQQVAEDKSTIIAEMSSIYRNSLFTIIAADGNDAEHGLTRLSRGSRITDGAEYMTATAHGVQLVPARPTQSNAIDRSYWGSRAWTYQEYLLSRRCVIFTHDEVFFQCPEVEKREAYIIRYTANDQKPGTKPMARSRFAKMDRTRSLHVSLAEQDLSTCHFGRYMELVESYTSRKLTHIGDRLDAFRALSDAFSGPNMQSVPRWKTAAHGIPLRFLPRALFWQQDDADGRQGSPLMSRLHSNARGDTYFPSWSWIGWSGRIQYSRFISVNARPRLTFTARDQWNMIGRLEEVVTEAERLPLVPNLCREPSAATTIHMNAYVAQVKIRGPHRAYHKGSEPDVFYICAMNGWKLGEVRIDPLYVAVRDPEYVYEAVSLQAKVLLGEKDVLLTAVDNGFHERISVWQDMPTVAIQQGWWQRNATYKYVRLR